VPIILEVVKQYAGKNILEVGNVLAHYFPVDHDILDKYEKVNDVINHDVVDFNPYKKYDLIVSISTLEHAGWDENPREPHKILRAIDNLKNLLASNGKIVATIHIGYNLELERLLRNKEIFTKMYCLKRTSAYNKWIEKGRNILYRVSYEFSVMSANAVAILVF
jgi:archaellum biogenesis ATPase FlaH